MFHEFEVVGPPLQNLLYGDSVKMTYDEERGVLNALIFDKSENVSMQVSLIRYYTLHFNLEA